MSKRKKRLLKFIVGDRVTFKNEYEMQMFGLFYIGNIIVRNEHIYYELYQLDENNSRVDIGGMYTDDNLIPIVQEQSKSLHKLKKRLKRKLRYLSLHEKPKKNKKLPLLDSILGYSINGFTYIDRSKSFTNKDDHWKHIKRIYPNAEYIFYQMIGYANNSDNEDDELYDLLESSRYY